MSMQCHTCFEFGHISRNCPTISCHMCGGPHRVRECTAERQAHKCVACGVRQHVTAKCEVLAQWVCRRVQGMNEARGRQHDRQHAAEIFAALSGKNTDRCFICFESGHKKQECTEVDLRLLFERDRKNFGNSQRASTGAPNDGFWVEQDQKHLPYIQLGHAERPPLSSLMMGQPSPRHNTLRKQKEWDGKCPFSVEQLRRRLGHRNAPVFLYCARSAQFWQYRQGCIEEFEWRQSAFLPKEKTECGYSAPTEGLWTYEEGKPKQWYEDGRLMPVPE